MNIHKNARLSAIASREMAVAVLGGRLTKAQAARLYGVSLKIVSRWTERFQDIWPGGDDGSLVAPHPQPPSNGPGHYRTDTPSSQTTPDR